MTKKLRCLYRREVWIVTEKPQDKLDKISDLAMEALDIDGAHHKQWYLEQILHITNPGALENLDEPPDRGIAP